MPHIVFNKDGTVHSTYPNLTDEEMEIVQSNTPHLKVEQVSLTDMRKNTIATPALLAINPGAAVIVEQVQQVKIVKGRIARPTS